MAIKRVSDLDPISINNGKQTLQAQDLIEVSEYSDSGTYVSKKITYNDLMKSIQKDIHGALVSAY